MVGHSRPPTSKPSQVQAQGPRELSRVQCDSLLDRSFPLPYHKEPVDAQLFPVACAFASHPPPSASFVLATIPVRDFCSCDTIIFELPIHQTPVHCQKFDSRISIHIVIASFKREDGDGAASMEPSSSPIWRIHTKSKTLEFIDQVQG